MATPLVFNEFLGWVDLTDPDNIPPGARLILAADLLRYENALKAIKDRVNLHDTSLVAMDPIITTLVSDLNIAEAALVTAQGNITTLTTNLNTANTNIAALTRGVAAQATTTLQMVRANRFYIHTGGAGTYTLPLVAGHTGVDFVIKNRGTGALLIQAETNKLWNTAGTTSSLSLPIGSQLAVVNDGTFWTRYV